MQNNQLDRVLFGASVSLVVIVCVPMILAPEQAAVTVTALYTWIANELGLLYQWATIGSTLVLVWLAFGKHGNCRLGGADARPDFSTISWMGMLFCAGIGAGLLYWSPIEWASYLDTPPFGLPAGSADAREWAATYGIFHWGLSAWCLYCLPTVAIAYPYYQRNIPYLRLSTSLVGLFGDSVVHKPLGRIVDLVFIIALIGGTGTSLGLATPMIAACMTALLGLAESLAMDITVMFIAVSLFSISVYLGLEKGIKRFSDANVIMAGIFIVFVLIAGPTFFQLKMGTNSLGLMLQDFVRLNTWTDPILETGFVQDWTIFYWAWWLAYGPFMGLFVTRISRGRTLKQLILGMVGFGTLLCALLYNPRQHCDVDGHARHRRCAGTRNHRQCRHCHRDGDTGFTLATLTSAGVYGNGFHLRRNNLRFGLLRHRRGGDSTPCRWCQPCPLASRVLGIRPRSPADHADGGRWLKSDSIHRAGSFPAVTCHRRVDDLVAHSNPARRTTPRD